MSLGSASADLVVRVITDTSKAKGLDETSSKTSKFSKGLATASKVAGGALLAVGAAAVAAGKAAAEDAASQAHLAQQMEKNAGASKSQIAATEDWITKMSMATGVADDELRPALATLVRATGDVEDSQKALAVAMDVSAATGKPLGAVSAAMAKGFAGSTTSLGKLVPGLSKAALASGDMGKVMDELKAKTGGAAKAAGETAAGKMKRFQLSLDETQEAAGAVLLPALMKLMTVLVKVGQWAQEHGTLFAVIAGGVAVMAAAVIALNLAVTIYTAVTTLAGSATLMAWAAALGPILLVVAAIAAVVAIVVILWKKSGTFRAIVLGTWRAIQVAAKATANVLKSVWRGVWTALSAYVRVYVTAFRVAFAVIRTVSKAVGDVLRSVWRAVWSALSGYVRAYLSVVRSIMSTIRSVVGTVAHAVTDAWRVVWSTLKAAASGVGRALSAPFDAIKRAVDGVVTAIQNLISWISRIKFPSAPSFLKKLPGSPFSATASPGVAGVSAYSVGAYAAPSVGFAGRASFAAPTPGYSIQINGLVHDPEGTARALRRILDNHDRRVATRAG